LKIIKARETAEAESDLGTATCRDCLSKLEPLADLLASPPPTKPFWQAGRYQIRIKGVKQLYLINVELDAKRRLFLAPSPVKPSVKYPETTVKTPLAVIW